jgi:hypothetical protein
MNKDTILTVTPLYINNGWLKMTNKKGLLLPEEKHPIAE